MMINKNRFRVSNDKKVLHKIGKRWVTVSALTLALLGGGALAGSVTTHAASNQPQAAQATKQPSTTPKGIMKTASALHANMLANAQNPASSASAKSSVVSQSASNASSKASSSNDTMNTLNSGTKSEQARGWNFVQHGINHNDYDNTKPSATSSSSSATQSTSSSASASSVAPSNSVSSSAKPSFNSAYQSYMAQMSGTDSEVASANAGNVQSDKKNVKKPLIKDNAQSDYFSGKVIRTGTARPSGLNFKIYANGGVEFTSGIAKGTSLRRRGRKLIGGNLNLLASIYNHNEAIKAIKIDSDVDISNVYSMSDTFSNEYLQSVILPSTFNTSNVTTMSDMFGNDAKLQNLTLPSSFNTSNVTNMSDMFSDCPDLQSLTLSKNFDTSKVTDMNNMFADASDLQELTIQSPNTKISDRQGSDGLPTMYQQLPAKDANGKNYTLAAPNDFSKGNVGTFVTTKNPAPQVTDNIIFYTNRSGRNVRVGSDKITGEEYTQYSTQTALNSAHINGYKLDSNAPQNITLGNTDSRVQIDSTQQSANSDDVPVVGNTVTFTGNIVLNFPERGSNHQITVPYSINTQVDDTLKNILSDGIENGNPSVAVPNDYINKKIQQFNTQNFTYTNANSSQASTYDNVYVQPADGTAGAAHVTKNHDGTYTYDNPDITFNFTANTVRENISYKYNNKTEGSTVQSGPNDTQASISSDTPNANVPAGWHIATGKNGEPQPNNSWTYGNDDTNNPHGTNPVNVEPNSASATVDYVLSDANASNNTSTLVSSTFSGNDYRATDAGDNSHNISHSTNTNASGTNSDGLPAGYHIINGQNPNVPYDNGTHTIKVIGNEHNPSDRDTDPTKASTTNPSTLPKTDPNYVPASDVVAINSVEYRAGDNTPVGTITKYMAISGRTGEQNTYNPNDYQPAGYSTDSNDKSQSVTIQPNGVTPNSVTFAYNAQTEDNITVAIQYKDNKGVEHTLARHDITGPTSQQGNIYTYKDSKNGNKQDLAIPQGYHFVSAFGGAQGQTPEPNSVNGSSFPYTITANAQDIIINVAGNPYTPGVAPSGKPVTPNNQDAGKAAQDNTNYTPANPWNPKNSNSPFNPKNANSPYNPNSPFNPKNPNSPLNPKNDGGNTNPNDPNSQYDPKNPKSILNPNNPDSPLNPKHSGSPMTNNDNPYDPDETKPTDKAKRGNTNDAGGNTWNPLTPDSPLNPKNPNSPLYPHSPANPANPGTPDNQKKHTKPANGKQNPPVPSSKLPSSDTTEPSDSSNVPSKPSNPKKKTDGHATKGGKTNPNYNPPVPSDSTGTDTHRGGKNTTPNRPDSNKANGKSTDKPDSPQDASNTFYVTVNDFDSKGSLVRSYQKRVIEEGTVGNTFQLNPSDYTTNGYNKDASDKNYTGYFGANALLASDDSTPQNSIVWNYKANPQSAMITYQDQAGNTVTGTIYGHTDSDINVTQPSDGNGNKGIALPAGYHVLPHGNYDYQFNTPNDQPNNNPQRIYSIEGNSVSGKATINTSYDEESDNNVTVDTTGNPTISLNGHHVGDKIVVDPTNYEKDNYDDSNAYWTIPMDWNTVSHQGSVDGNDNVTNYNPSVTFTYYGPAAEADITYVDVSNGARLDPDVRNTSDNTPYMPDDNQTRTFKGTKYPVVGHQVIHHLGTLGSIVNLTAKDSKVGDAVMIAPKGFHFVNDNSNDRVLVPNVRLLGGMMKFTLFLGADSPMPKPQPKPASSASVKPSSSASVQPSSANVAPSASQSVAPSASSSASSYTPQSAYVEPKGNTPEPVNTPTNSTPSNQPSQPTVKPQPTVTPKRTNTNLNKPAHYVPVKARVQKNTALSHRIVGKRSVTAQVRYTGATAVSHRHLANVRYEVASHMANVSNMMAQSTVHEANIHASHVNAGSVQHQSTQRKLPQTNEVKAAGLMGAASIMAALGLAGADTDCKRRRE